jgi:hypothetical protein
LDFASGSGWLSICLPAFFLLISKYLASLK